MNYKLQENNQFEQQYDNNDYKKYKKQTKIMYTICYSFI